MSLRWKIAAAVTGVCCAVAVVLGVLVHNVVARQVTAEVRKEANARLDAAAGEYEHGTVTSRTDTAVDPPDLPAPLRELVSRGERGSMVAVKDGLPVMWAARPADGRPLAVWTSYSATHHQLNSLDTAILGSAVLAAALVTCAGLVLAARISRRLWATAQVARQITGGDLNARVGAAAGGGAGRDEVREVAEALDTMAASLQERLETEKRFTADVAHELRTPLAGMVAAAGLLPAGRPSEMINDRLDALRSLTEDLLEISRLDAGAERAELTAHELGPLVERAVRSSGLTAEVRVVRDAVVWTERRRLDRVVVNLVVNAHRHGRPPVVVTVDGPSVEVRDHGDGYPRELIEQGPQRFRTGDPGRGRSHGLGLTIVLGQARVLSTGLEFTNARDGGARTVLRLPTTADPGRR